MMKKFIKFIIAIIVIFLILVVLLFIVLNKDNDSLKKESDNIKTNDNNLKEDDKEMKFGKYYINNDKDLEPIEWIVLDEKDNKKLLVTKYAIDSVPYNNTRDAVSWDNSDIRKWLNDDFYNIAFNDEEKKKIVLTKNTALENPNHKDNKNIGSDTEDNVFLLSYQEVSKYFKDESDRLLKPTKYAVQKGAYTNSDGNVAWWTRSAGLTPTSPEYLASAGDFGVRQHQEDETIVGTRPAIWVKDDEK